MTKTINGIMEVTVVGAKGLKNMELFGRMDPYVVLEYNSQQHKCSAGHRGQDKKTMGSKLRLKCCMCMHGQGAKPVWNEKFKFQVDYKLPSEVDHKCDANGTETNGVTKKKEQQKLIVKIMDRDNFTQDDFLGQATIYLKELFEQGDEDGKAELRPQKYRVVTEDKSYRGEIQVGVVFTSTKGEIVELLQENGGKKGGERHQENGGKKGGEQLQENGGKKGGERLQENGGKKGGE